MSWIGLSDSEVSVFRRTGISGEPDRAIAGALPEDVLKSGTFWIQFDAHVGGVRQNLLRYGAREPIASGFTICMEPDGSVCILSGHNDRHMSLRLPTELLGRETGVLLSLSWEGASRSLVLSLYVPETGYLCQSELRGKLPLTLRDWRRIIESTHHTKVDSHVTFWAVSDEIEPFGIAGSFGANCTVETMRGTVTVQELRPGQFVLTADGDIAQVRWVGSHIVPARGRFTPHLVRAPYYGAQRDLIMSGEQFLCLSGSEIEYNFGLETVGASVAQLANRRSILPVRSYSTIELFQILLDRPAVYAVSGVNVSGFDPNLHTGDRSTLRHSMLRELPSELIPEMQPLDIHHLRLFEAASLSR